MRTLSVTLLALTVSSGLFAQQSSTPAGRFFGPMASGWPAQPVAYYEAIRTYVVTASAQCSSEQVRVACLATTLLPHGPIASATFGIPGTVPPLPPAKSCSVALLQMPISKNVDPFMPQARLAMDHIAPMPQARVPAPACDSSPCAIVAVRVSPKSVR
jgi:hypothetical protein